MNKSIYINQSAGSKKIFTDYIKKKYSGWKISGDVRVIHPARKSFPGEYTAKLIRK